MNDISDDFFKRPDAPPSLKKYIVNLLFNLGIALKIHVAGRYVTGALR